MYSHSFRVASPSPRGLVIKRNVVSSLFGFLARPSLAVSLATGSELAEVVTAALGNHGAAFAPQSGSG